MASLSYVLFVRTKRWKKRGYATEVFRFLRSTGKVGFYDQATP
jgi:hypothetical protein